MPQELTLDPRAVRLTTRTNTEVRRTLPHRDLVTIGAWCFVDHYGPTSAVDAMSIAQHPHVGLQTVSWLFEGEIEHRDSLGSVQVIEPGELNLMTSGIGIVHSELSLIGSNPLHGVQLWVALPARSKDVPPHFEHHKDLPEVDFQGLRSRVIMGSWLGETSPAKTYSPMVGAEISGADVNVELPLQEGFEYGVLIVDGEIQVNEHLVTTYQLQYLSPGNKGVKLISKGYFRGLLIGGTPFNEEIIMWWNFIGRTHDEIVEIRRAWEEGSERFPSFTDHIGERIPAPELPHAVLKPRNAKPHLRNGEVLS